MEWNGSECEATDLGWDFDKTNHNFIPEYNVALISLSTYPLSTCTAERNFSGMKRLPTRLRRTWHDDIREIALSCNSAHTQAQGRNWYWWHYNRVCPSEGTETPNLKIFCWGSMPPDSPRFGAPSPSSAFSSAACTLKISRHAANYRHLIVYEINAQGWKKRLGLEGVGGVGRVHFKNCYCQGGIQFSHAII